MQKNRSPLLHNKNQIPTLKEIKLNRKPIRNVAVIHKQTMNALARFALWVTKKVGSVGFFLVLVTWTIGWLGWNTFAPASYHFDPYPSFVVWMFISNIMQILLIPLLMIGQNLDNEHNEIRAELDYEVNKRTEHEIETIIMRLEHLHQLLQSVIDSHHTPNTKTKE